MIEVLTFIFSSFWIWLGTLLLVEAVFEGFRGLFRGRTISEKRLKKILTKNPEEK